MITATLTRTVAVSMFALAACSGGTASTPDITGASVRSTAPSTHGANGSPSAPVAALTSCDPDFRPTTTTMFNDPSGSRTAQFRLQAYLVKLIDCTPPANPDGTRASIKFTFYSLTYGPVERALVAAAGRGVSVQVLSSSHADRFRAWRDLVQELGSDTRSDSFAVTCWQGCLHPRQPPVPGGPTAWFTARAVSADSRTAVFTDLSKAGRAQITRWSWDFGDGTHAEGPGPHRKTYQSEGIYLTSLTVRDSAGVTHQSSGNVTIPDSLEPMYPALHAKVLVSSTVGTGTSASRWVSAYGSGNPTYTQAQQGFNNLNVSVGDPELYQAFDDYISDLIAASQGTLLTRDYYRTISTHGNTETGSPATVVHFLPRESGDLQLSILRSIQCRYTRGGKSRRTKVRISMFALSRIEIGAELWRLAYERGCSVDLVYTTMTQRLRSGDGAWIRDDDGPLMQWGPADCLATPPTRQALTVLTPGGKVERAEVANTIYGPTGLCAGGTLDGRLAGARAGTWMDLASPITGGRLTVTAACPSVTQFDKMLGQWVVLCRGSHLFTHQKVLLVDGMIHGRVQKYVMTGSANWTKCGLLSNDEVVTELLDAPAIHAAYLAAHELEKDMLADNPGARAAE